MDESNHNVEETGRNLQEYLYDDPMPIQNEKIKNAQRQVIQVNKSLKLETNTIFEN